jgi:hypothetical protein
MDYGYYSDGVAIFWKIDRFEKMGGNASFYGQHKNGSRGVGMVRLKSTFAGVEQDHQQEVIVAGTHLKAKEVTSLACCVFLICRRSFSH